MFESWRATGAAREQADGVVAVLQRELLVPVDHDVANAHLEAMSLEFAVNRASFAGGDRRMRRVPRAVVGSALVAGALTFMSGLGAAGALPAPAQHWLSGATRVFGIHLPDRSAHPSGPPGGSRPAASVGVAPNPSTNVPADRVPNPSTTRRAGAGSASSPNEANATGSAVVHGEATPPRPQTSPVDSPATQPDPAPAQTPSSNAGGNGNSTAAVHANGGAGGNGNAAAAHVANAGTSHAGGNGNGNGNGTGNGTGTGSGTGSGNGSSNGNTAAAHANSAANGKQGSSAASATAKPGAAKTP